MQVAKPFATKGFTQEMQTDSKLFRPRPLLSTEKICFQRIWRASEPMSMEVGGCFLQLVGQACPFLFTLLAYVPSQACDTDEMVAQMRTVGNEMAAVFPKSAGKPLVTAAAQAQFSKARPIAQPWILTRQAGCWPSHPHRQPL